MAVSLKYDYLLAFIAAVWVVFFSFVLQLKPGLSLIGDDLSYLNAAKLLCINGKLDNTRPLLISALEGFPFLFKANAEFVVKWGLFLNFSCWLLTDILLFKILLSKIGRKKAFLISILFLFCIGNLAHAFNFLSESIFIFMIVLSVYFVAKYYETNRYTFLTIALCILLLNALVKPVSIGLAFILVFFFVTKITKILFNRYSFLLVISSFLLFFQMYSMKKNYGDYTLSYIGAVTYYNYLGAKADCYQKNIAYFPGENERTRLFSALSNPEMVKTADRDLEFQLKNNTYNLAKAYLFCLYSNSHKGNFIVSECKNEKQTAYFDFFYFVFKAISKLQNIVFTLFSVLFSFYLVLNFRKVNPFLVLISVFVLYLFFISGMSCFQCDRFHIAFFPLFMMLFAGLIFKSDFARKTNRLT